MPKRLAFRQTSDSRSLSKGKVKNGNLVFGLPFPVVASRFPRWLTVQAESGKTGCLLCGSFDGLGPVAGLLRLHLTAPDFQVRKLDGLERQAACLEVLERRIHRAVRL